MTLNGRNVTVSEIENVEIKFKKGYLKTQRRDKIKNVRKGSIKNVNNYVHSMIQCKI